MILATAIKNLRTQLGESQEEFGARFKVHGNTVSRWENGVYEVPNRVTEFLMTNVSYEKVCPVCTGTGKVRAMPLWNKEESSKDPQQSTKEQE